MSKANRYRLINAIVFFAENTQCCGKIKLFKLLYLLDFEHFKQTGKSVTGFEYQAWKFGPVPVDLMEEWEDLGADLARAIRIVPEKVVDFERLTVEVNPAVQFDPDDFTTRQLNIMQALAARYKSTFSPKMIDVTHEQNGAWDKIWNGGRGSHKVIPYSLAIAEDMPDRDAFLKIASEQAMYQSALDAARSSLEA
ncbi:MAG: Panacea domain-containing protein [Pseudomonas sp.]|uniref:Panacea domain-containing protein n=1 Tax=Pseudomonas sp. UMAB-08 TaxID=1365375 RepID=UPI001C56E909|nr:Panacea domain-containing protein [Pseudomonas sp. UMAB-08]